MKKTFLLLSLLALSTCVQRVKPIHSDLVTVKVVPIEAESTRVQTSYVGKAEATGATTLSAPYAGTLVYISLDNSNSAFTTMPPSEN